MKVAVFTIFELSFNGSAVVSYGIESSICLICFHYSYGKKWGTSNMVSPLLEVGDTSPVPSLDVHACILTEAKLSPHPFGGDTYTKEYSLRTCVKLF